MRFSGMAAQFTLTKGWFRRSLARWTVRATISLPTPVSPVMSTVESVLAIFLMVRNTCCIFPVDPMISGEKYRSSSK